MAKSFSAKTSDKYELYQLSVQSAENDVQFLLETYQAERGKAPKHFREDFCGTCLLSMHWVKLGTDKTAEAYDIDPEPLEWGRLHNLPALGDDIGRVKQFLKDAREPSEKTPDVRCAQNFSYWVFKTRPENARLF